MIYFVFLSFFIHLNYAYSMEENLIHVNHTYPWEENQEDTVKKLTSVITFQDPDDYNYLKWSYQPLAENFKKNDAWSADIVPHLLSTNPILQQKANKNCEILLNTISKNKNQLYEEQRKANKYRELWICFPIIALFIQLYFNLYEPFTSLGIMEITRHCTTNADVLEDVSKAFSRHRQQLILIEGEISTTMYKSKDPTQRQNFITQLLQNHQKEKKIHTNLINLLEQKPLSLKKND